MKGSGPLVAALFVASTAALSSSSSVGIHNASFPLTSSNQGTRIGALSSLTVSEREKFAPQFDGLRFIETLITAHR
ncbi:hypothetical protein F3Y22_tig00008957pilonHSYRG00103 [Hibiscus syriacus]|uniref:Uncharacterized protein n=1 Tax=Hibiscus syriacus TaxID=106335 RepID=A0A6A3C897_HIBSY|nr:hypothetical protein F3Y22_tig00008957pilonHSYRG00103 [Hibiscus syriacus]